MTINTQKDGAKLTISVEGKLVTNTAPQLENELKANTDGVTELVFDLKKLDYMASAGLRIILTAAKIMKDQGTLKVINVNEPVMEVFNLTGMSDVLDINAL